MTISRYVLPVIAGLVVVVAWYGLAQHKAPGGITAGTAPATVRATPAAQRATEWHAATAASHTDAPSPPTANSYAKAFRAAASYQEFIQSAFPAAQNGDRDAEYYLSAALGYCDETYRFFFRRRNKTLSVDEAIAERAALPGNNSMTEAIHRAYNRCHGVYDALNPAWGTADQWLAKAAEDGQPVAQILTAEKVFVQITAKGSVPTPKPGTPVVASTITEARSLARAAVETRDPEVVFQIGGLVNLLKPELSSEESGQEMLTWEYVACLRGLDCGANAEWLLQFCLAQAPCLPGESGINYLRRAAQVKMFDLEQKASTLNAKLDAQAWDELGLAN